MGKMGTLDGKLVALIGGTGFLGQQVAQALLARGARVRIAARHPEKAFALKPLANLGQLQFARIDLTDRANAERVAEGADAVVNLAGSFTGNIARLMGDAPGWLAAAAAHAGAEAFVHVSAIAPAPDAQRPNGYADAKHAGEAAVLAAFPKATVLRPSVLFGSNDRFLNMFAGLIQRLPALPVFGPDAKLQPLFVGDAAEAIARALENPGKHGGKTYDIGGPEVVTMMDLNRRIASAQGRTPLLLAVPDSLSSFFAALPGTPMSSDQWAMLQAGSTVNAGMDGMKALGIVPRPLGLFLDKWMTRYRRHGRFAGRIPA